MYPLEDGKAKAGAQQNPRERWAVGLQCWTRGPPTHTLSLSLSLPPSVQCQEFGSLFSEMATSTSSSHHSLVRPIRTTIRRLRGRKPTQRKAAHHTRHWSWLASAIFAAIPSRLVQPTSRHPASRSTTVPHPTPLSHQTTLKFRRLGTFLPSDGMPFHCTPLSSVLASWPTSPSSKSAIPTRYPVAEGTAAFRSQRKSRGLTV